MIALLRLVHLPWWRRHPLQAALPIMGVALGVAAIVAVDLGSNSTVASFRSTMEKLEGRATHQVVAGDSSVKGEWAPQIARLPLVFAAAPVLEAVALLQPSGEPLTLVGVDPFSEADVRSLGLAQLASRGDATGLLRRFLGEPGALAVSRPVLRRHGLHAGDRITLILGALRRRAFVLTELPERVNGIRVPDNLALCDLATAQELTGRRDVTRIDLVLSARNRQAAVAAVEAVLPAGVRVVAAGGRAARLSSMLAALRTNLAALSYLALFVSLFLIYNAMLLAVLRRRAQIGLLRCLGATRGQVWWAWLVEAGVIAGIGTALGLLLGVACGGAAMRGFARTASDLYASVHADALTLSPWTFVKALIAGMVVSIAAAAFPAAEAARTTPAHTAARSQVEQGFARARRRVVVAALAMLGVMGIALAWPSTRPAPGYVAAVALALSAAGLAPMLADRLLASAQGVLRTRWSLLLSLAATNIRASMSRTGVALSALAIALSMSVAMETMVGSFRRELRDWIAETVRADLYVSPAGARVERLDARLPVALVDELRRHPKVEAIDTYRALTADVALEHTAASATHSRVGAQSRASEGALGPAASSDWTCIAAGVEVAVFAQRAHPHMLDGQSAEAFVLELQHGKVGVTESLMRHVGVHAGDRLLVRAGGRAASVEVAGVYRDYTSDRGVVLMDRAAWERAFGAHDPNSVALYLSRDADVDSTLVALQRELSGRYALLIRSNRGLRDEALRVFDRTFSITRGLELIGIAVAAIGIAAALLAMLMERRRELATLRALGLTPRRLGALLLVESALLATIAWLFSLGIGSALAAILVGLINLRSFGWALPFHVPALFWLRDLAIALAAAGVATVLPLARALHQPPARALHEE